ncbi:MAG: hypothetical protein WC089_02660 [Candidatus Paceibacterota bacterium]
MSPETRACVNCKGEFVVEPEDFVFYDKIKVPPPTFCPECRMQRRLAWRNERGLYFRKNDKPGSEEKMISTYPESIPVSSYDNTYWWSDSWDAISFGCEYDLSRDFFSQYKDLLYRTPLISFFDSKGVNNQFCNYITESKNNYMLSAVWTCEDSMYSNRISFCQNTVDSYISHKLDFSYEDIYCGDSSRLFYSENSYNCVNSYFLFDCRNCTDCFMCNSLRNKSYCINNIQYSKDEYKEKIKEFNLSSYASIQNHKASFELLKKNAIRKYAQLTNCVNVVGDNMQNAKDAYYSFDLPRGVENIKYCNWGTFGLKDSYDVGPGAGGKSELTYEGISIGVANSNVKFSVVVWNSTNVEYSFNCYSCNNCFGCVSLKNKNYCIFNKQYEKDEYFELLGRIKKQMNEIPYSDSMGNIYKYGEFFPIEIAPYAYNDTVAGDFFPLNENDLVQKNFQYIPKVNKQYNITVKSSELPDSIIDVNDSILGEIVECKNINNDKYVTCTKAYKMNEVEVSFYKRLVIPLPRVCYSCRHADRLSKRNPMKLWHRQCMCDLDNHDHVVQCDVEFETSYSPDRPEKVYCEKCYQKEVL